MPIMDINNPKMIAFLIENYEKEARLRINWIDKNSESIKEAATLTREPTGYYDTDILAYNMKEGMHTLKRDHVVASFNRRQTPIRDGTFIPTTKHLRHGHSMVDVGLGDPKVDPRLARPDSDLTMDPIMRPVDPTLTKILYSHLPRRAEYLEKRTKILPEKRYYGPECVNWDYGWRMKDSIYRGPSHGRVWALTRSLKGRSGPAPDPKHYQSSEIPGVSKCVVPA